ncbi:MAG: LUD domain-containing protein [Anaerolineae bacterium]|nr:LUD domain-containing protein [Anaerolineae bacterium]
MNDRETILQAIRDGLKQAVLPEARPQPPVNTLPRAAATLSTFITELTHVSGQVIQCDTPQAAAQQVAALCQERGWQEALAWEWAEIGCPGLAEALAQAGVRVVHDDHDPHTLAHIPVGLTGAEAGLAESGTLLLRKRAGRSALASLLPPVHIALLPASRVVPDMVSYFELVGDAAAFIRDTSNLVFITGPSRTGDIEQVLTLGVHGPKELIVVLWGLRD